MLANVVKFLEVLGIGIPMDALIIVFVVLSIIGSIFVVYGTYWVVNTAKKGAIVVLRVIRNG